MSPSSDATAPIQTSETLEQQIKSAVHYPGNERVNKIRDYKQKMDVVSMRLDKIYQILAVNLLPSLLCTHNQSGSELNKMQS